VIIVVGSYRPDVGRVPQLWQHTSRFGVIVVAVDGSASLGRISEQ
jgi:hypothetical protein